MSHYDESIRPMCARKRLLIECSRRTRRLTHPGSEPQEQEGRPAFLPQAAEGFAVRPKSDHHRQAEELPRGEG